MNMKVQNENLPQSDVGADDEAVSLFAKIANEDSDKDSVNLNVEQLDQDEDEQQAGKGNGSQQEQQDADPWQSVPDSLRAQFNQLQQANQRLQQQYGAVSGRLAPTQRELEALKKQLAQQEQQKLDGKKSGPTAAEISGMTDDELEQEWPEVAAALKRREQQLLQQMDERFKPLQHVQNELSQFREQQQQQVRQQHVQQELAKVAQAHPDYQQVAADPEFRTWLQKQPPSVQSIASSMSADDNIALLNLYKQANPSATKQGSQRPGKTSLRDQAEIPRKGAGRAAVDPNSADPVALFNQIAT